MKKTIIITAATVLALILIIGFSCLIFKHVRFGNRNGCCVVSNSNNKQYFKKIPSTNNNKSSFNNPLNNKNQILDYAVKLKLTDDQASKINTLIKNDDISLKALQDKIQANMLQIREMEWSKNFVQATIDKLQKEINDSRNTLKLNQQKLKVDIQAILTSEQLAQYKTLNPMKGISNLRNRSNLDENGNRFYRNDK